MIEIGKQKLVAVRVKTPGGALKIKTGPDGAAETRLKSSDVWRVTRDTLGGSYGPDRSRKLVVGLVAVDQMVLYPKGTRQKIRVNLVDVYAWALRSKAQRAQLKKARERKDKLAAQRTRQKIRAGDRRLSSAARRAN